MEDAVPEQAKQPIRLTHQRAEALLAVFESGVSLIETYLKSELSYVTLKTAEELAELKQTDAQLAAAKDAAAIIRHRYTGTEIPMEPTATLF